MAKKPKVIMRAEGGKVTRTTKQVSTPVIRAPLKTNLPSKK